MRFLILIQNADVRQSNFRRTYQPDALGVVNYLVQNEVLPGEDPTSAKIYQFCEQTGIGGFLLLRDGNQGRRMIEIYAIAAESIGPGAG